MNNHNSFLAGLIFLSFLATACSGGPAAQPPGATQPPGLTLDPVLRAYYNYLGGESLLGPPISEPFEEGEMIAQYVRAGKLTFHSGAPANSRFRLAPLGRQLGISEPSTSPSANPGLHYLGGHTILPDFYPLYEKLGALTVGMPLTEARHNYIRSRWEQYFENLAFYREDGSEEVHLLAYGDWACAQFCGQIDAGVTNAIIDILPGNTVDPKFRDFYNRHGSDFTGFTLDPAGLGPDGEWEQIFENVVLFSDSQALPGDVRLRPMGGILRIPVEAPRPYSGEEGMYFLPSADPTLGYEIPSYFWEYVSKHGGLTLFGQPITHLGLFNGSAYHQCFQNMCLTFDPGAGEAARVRPEPLGHAYRYLYGSANSTAAAPVEAPTLPPVAGGGMPGQEPAATAFVPPAEPTAVPTQAAAPALPTDPAAVVPTLPAPTEIIAPALPTDAGVLVPTPVVPTPVVPTEAIAPTLAAPTAVPVMREITLQVMVRFKVVETQEAQEIGARVMENGFAVPGAVVDVTVGMPDGSFALFPMTPTDLNGYTGVTLPAIAAPPSTVVPYKVCYTVQADMRVCVAESFVIWNTP